MQSQLFYQGNDIPPHHLHSQQQMPMVIMQNGQLFPLNQNFPPSLYGFPPDQFSRSINTYNMTHSTEQIEVPE
ncbi:unnamed protein product, partial [Rotaria magnacalcarata]